MDPDPDPRKEMEVDPDPERGLKWIRIRPNAVDPGGSGSGQMQWIRVDPDPDPKRWFRPLTLNSSLAYLDLSEIRPPAPCSRPEPETQKKNINVWQRQTRR